MNADSLPVSVFVTPRLAGADKLGAFPTGCSGRGA